MVERRVFEPFVGTVASKALTVPETAYYLHRGFRRGEVICLWTNNQVTMCVIDKMVSPSLELLGELRRLKRTLKGLGVQLDAKYLSLALNMHAARLSRYRRIWDWYSTIRATSDSRWAGASDYDWSASMEGGRLCPAAPGALAPSACQGRGGRVNGHHVGPAGARQDVVPQTVRDGFPLPLHPGPRPRHTTQEELGRGPDVLQPGSSRQAESVTSFEQAVVRGLVAGSGVGRTGAVVAGVCLKLEGVERSRVEVLVFHGNNFMGYFEEERFQGRIAYPGT
jgi:hypothetical protein